MATGRNYQGRDGEIRFLDNSQGAQGAAATPFGIRVAFEQMDLTISPRPRPEDMIRMDRERFNDNTHLLIGSEEDLLIPTDITLGFRMSSEETDAVLQFVGFDWAGLEGASTGDATNPWAVKGTPTAGLVSTKNRALSGDGLYVGGVIDSKGSAVRLPTFADKKKVAVDIETIWNERDGSNKFGMRLKEVFFDPGRQSINESAEDVVVRLTGSLYGNASRITAFSRARDVLKGTSVLF